MKSVLIKIELTPAQLESLVQFSEDEQEYWEGLGSVVDAEQWSTLRDKLAYELDMIVDFPFDKVATKV